ncbi:hypothetical protein C8Q78DRAFT_219710 [Trametes maxima]|nr:hypothetical protein C8Q78DRAFT_219710 [Trametes maxima]
MMVMARCVRRPVRTGDCSFAEMRASGTGAWASMSRPAPRDLQIPLTWLGLAGGQPTQGACAPVPVPARGGSCVNIGLGLQTAIHVAELNVKLICTSGAWERGRIWKGFGAPGTRARRRTCPQYICIQAIAGPSERRRRRHRGRETGDGRRGRLPSGVGACTEGRRRLDGATRAHLAMAMAMSMSMSMRRRKQYRARGSLRSATSCA